MSNAISALTDATLPLADNTIFPVVDPDEPSVALRNKKTTLDGILDAAALRSNQSFRNFIFGGNLTTNPWQRGTTFAGLTGTLTTRTADGMTWESVGAGVVSVIKTADAPTAAQADVYTQHCAHVDVTTADASIAVSDYYTLEFPIEPAIFLRTGFGTAGAKTLTVSFWAKHTKTGTHCVALTDGASRSYVREYTINVTDTWEYKTTTFPGETSGAVWNAFAHLVFSAKVGNNFNTTAGAWQSTGYLVGTSSGVNNMDSTSNNMKFALVQLEVGTSASPYEVLPHGIVLIRAQRYLQKSFQQGVTPAQNTADRLGAAFSMSHVASATFGTRVPFPVIMRAAPTITTYNPNAANANWRDITNSADRTVTVSQQSDSGFVVTGATGSAAAQNMIHWMASAEL